MHVRQWAISALLLFPSLGCSGATATPPSDAGASADADAADSAAGSFGKECDGPAACGGGTSCIIRLLHGVGDGGERVCTGAAVACNVPCAADVDCTTAFGPGYACPPACGTFARVCDGP